MIRKGRQLDLESLMQLATNCAKFMAEHGIYQWNDSYPNPSVFSDDIKREELYVLVKQEKVIGCITISIHMDEEYVPVKWLTANARNIYIHRLAIHPNYQGLGYARSLMDYAENYAKDNDFRSIRLDTFSQNKRNQKFYELRGYKRLGNIYFPQQSEFPFYCYELIL